MSTAISDIKSTNWQISTAGFGFIAEGLSDIRQCLDILLRTYKGSDSLRPEFGCGIFQYIDQPVNVAIPNMKRSMLEAIAIWEKRIKVISIKHYLQESNIFFNITYKLVDQDLIDSLLLNATTNTVAVNTGLILQAFYPPNPFGRFYNIDLTLNDTAAIPHSLPSGFATLNALFAWVSDHWASYGRWVQLVDRIVLYANNIFTSGAIEIALMAGSISVEALLPQLAEGEVFDVSFSPNGGSPVPAYSGTTDTYENLLLWVQSNWGDYGTWSITSGARDVLGDFSAFDFNNDYAIGRLYNYYLVLNSTTLNSAELTVTAV